MATIAVPDQLTRTWRTPPGVVGWLSAVNHRSIGRRFIVTAFVFFLIGGVQALLLRVQLGTAENTFLDAEQYNALFTMHGTTMMFLFAVPIGEAFATYLIPLMVGARDLAFPRADAFGYWCYLFGGIFLYTSFLVDAAPDGGWFNYVPLTGPEFSPGINIDYWLLGTSFVEIATIIAAVELIVTIFKMRAPGMSLNRLPIFAWNILVTAFMILFAFLPLVAASTLLELDRAFGTRFYDPEAGGNPLLWQHLFWVFGHPEVYVIFLPAAGAVSMIIPTFARRPIVGYPWVVMAVVAIGFISFGLWVHHMFTTGLPNLAYSFFAANSMMIVVANGIQFFAWIATLWRGKLVMRTPLLWALGTLVTFLIGGITGAMVGAVPFDWQAHDTFFVVAHFHYVLIGGAVFPLIGALYYWFPKLAGRMLDERLGQVSFWLAFVGFQLTMFPMHLSGLEGMPRRVYTYEEELGIELWNRISTAGAFVLATGFVLTFVNILWSRWHGERAGDDPWEAGTLEWATTSPPQPYNFRIIPTIRSRYPLWAQPELGGLGEEVEREALLAEQANGRAVAALRSDQRGTYGTTLLDARPDHVEFVPQPTLWPLVLAIGAVCFFGGILVGVYALVGVAVVIGVVALLGWHWPSKAELPTP